MKNWWPSQNNDWRNLQTYTPMLFFRRTVINEIMSSSNEGNVEGLIDSAVQKLKFKNVNGHVIQRFITGMERDLRHERAGDHTINTLRKVDLAIDHLKQLKAH